MTAPGPAEDPRTRSSRVAPSFNVEAPSEAILAVADFGSFAAPLGLAPALIAAGASQARGPRGHKKRPLARKPLESR
jgi:hypothetical protein